LSGVHQTIAQAVQESMTMSDNTSDNSISASLPAGVSSVRSGGVTYGQTPTPHVSAERSAPVVRHSGPNEFNTFQPFDETAVGDLSGVQPFRDTTEVQAAMRDPRYDRSAAYRNEVLQRMAAMRQQG
jgi:hypothetical protein